MSRKKLIAQILLCLFVFCVWILDFRDASEFQMMEVPAGDTTFTAVFPDIAYITICNEDISLHNLPDSINCNVNLTILDDEGTIAAMCDAGDMRIHTNGYTNLESASFSNLPVHLNTGKTYTLKYDATMVDGTKLSDLSFLLYGSGKRSSAFYGIFLLLLFTAASLTIWCGRKRIFLVYSVIWWTLILAAMTSMVTVVPEEDSSAFADVYASSSKLLGRAGTDAEGYCYIEESGLRNSGYLTYRIPIVRFWTNSNIGNSIEKDKSSLIYQRDHRGNVLQVPAILITAFMRLGKAPWQGIWIGIWMIQALLAYVLIAWLIHYTKGMPAASALVFIIGLLPSVQIAVLSCTEAGLAFLIFFAGILRVSLERKALFRKTTAMICTSVLLAIFVLWSAQTLRFSKIFLPPDQVLEELALYRPEPGLYILPFLLLFILVVIIVRYGRECAESKSALPPTAFPILVACAWMLCYANSGFMLLPVLVLPYCWGKRCMFHIKENTLVRLTTMLSVLTALIRLQIR